MTISQCPVFSLSTCITCEEGPGHTSANCEQSCCTSVGSYVHMMLFSFLCKITDVTHGQSARWGYSPGLQPQKLFSFQNFTGGKKYHL